jgi:hypothetical protein
VGVFGAFAALAFDLTVEFAERLLLGGLGGYHPPAAGVLDPPVEIPPCPSAGGSRWSPPSAASWLCLRPPARPAGAQGSVSGGPPAYLVLWPISSVTYSAVLPLTNPTGSARLRKQVTLKEMVRRVQYAAGDEYVTARTASRGQLAR